MTVLESLKFAVIGLMLICGLAPATVFASSHASTPGVKTTLPIFKRSPTALRKRQQKSAPIGLGDNADAAYSVEIQVGTTNVPVLLDTGSADLWAISTDCSSSSCGFITDTPQISPSSLNSSNLPIVINYGDSLHSTSASGLIYSGPISIAGLQLKNQYIAVINDTDAGLSDQNLSGIFGIGFPGDSDISQALLISKLGPTPNINDAQLTDAFNSALPTQGPLLTRLITSGQLEGPMFTVTLQRETIEVGGNVGQLTIGKLPDGVSNNSLTWVPVRLYTEAQGGLAGPTSSPKEVYPIRWEIPLDDVLLNGQTLPKPNLQTGYTALVDSGTSFLAGPNNLVQSIYSAIAPGSDFDPTFRCATPINMTFVIGGKNFPLDPRDFLGQQNGPENCFASMLSPTDEPSVGSLMSWVLGDPFMKSNLVAYYFGNLTHPSVDPPRMGFLSTVPSNAAALLEADITSAEQGGSPLVVTSTAPPSGTPAAASTDSVGVAQAPSMVAITTMPGGGGGQGGGSGVGSGNGGAHLQVPWSLIVALVIVVWMC